MTDTETELTLIVASDDPEACLEQIAGLARIAQYHLRPRPDELIHDFYLDTPEGDLRGRRLALRIRVKDGRHFVALKGELRQLPGGGAERLEIEHPWSPRALVLMVGELRARGVPLREPANLAASDQPVAAGDESNAAHRLGLHVIQDRETMRTVRDVLDRDPAGAVIAELAVDAVVYHLPETDVRHFEVEIESKAPGGEAALQTIAAALQERYRADLRLGSQSKLALGEKIQRLQREGVLSGLLDARGRLRPAAYDRLELDCAC